MPDLCLHLFMIVECGLYSHRPQNLPTDDGGILWEICSPRFDTESGSVALGCQRQAVWMLLFGLLPSKSFQLLTGGEWARPHYSVCCLLFDLLSSVFWVVVFYESVWIIRLTSTLFTTNPTVAAVNYFSMKITTVYRKVPIEGYYYNNEE